MSDRDCEHGHLARSCRICELERELAAMTKERDRLQDEIDDIKDHQLGVEKVAYELAKVRADRAEKECDRLGEQLQGKVDRENIPCADALEELWQDIIIRRKPDYGPWEYPGQAYRHIMAEFRDVEAERDALVMAVAKVRKGESRFETALRYIREREQNHGEAGQVLGEK